MINFKHFEIQMHQKRIYKIKRNLKQQINKFRSKEHLIFSILLTKRILKFVLVVIL